MKTAKIGFENIAGIAISLRKEFKDYKYEKDGEKVVFYLKKEEIGFIESGSEDSDVIKYDGKQIIEFVDNKVDVLKKNTKEKLTTQDTESNVVVLQTLYGFEDNKPLYEKMCQDFKKAGIEKVFFNKEIKVSNFMTKKPTLYVVPTINIPNYKSESSGYDEKLKKTIKEFVEWSKKSEPSFATSSARPPVLDEKEKVEQIKIGTTTVGYYYRERNGIVLLYNFMDIEQVFGFSEELPIGIKKLIDLLVEQKIKAENIDEMSARMFVSVFLKNIDGKITESENSVKSFQRDIVSCENTIRQRIDDIHEKNRYVEFLKNAKTADSTVLTKQFDALKKLPFITNYSIDGGILKLKYKPTSLVIEDFRRIEFAESCGKRTIYLGALEWHISPEQFAVYSDAKMLCGNPHTHAGSGGNPCFGEGDARNKIYSFLAQLNFVEMAKMLWFWIKTHRESGSYIKMGAFYDDRLQQGLPVWDEKGNRISINDEKKIAAKEQQRLSKSSNYDANIKKYAEVKP